MPDCNIDFGFAWSFSSSVSACKDPLVLQVDSGAVPLDSTQDSASLHIRVRSSLSEDQRAQLGSWCQRCNIHQ